MTEVIQPKTDKRTYTKPEVTEVRLVAGEAVLGYCKTEYGGRSLCEGIDTSCYPNQGSHS